MGHGARCERCGWAKADAGVPGACPERGACVMDVPHADDGTAMPWHRLTPRGVVAAMWVDMGGSD